jgi:hypothetical protein
MLARCVADGLCAHSTVASPQTRLTFELPMKGGRLRPPIPFMSAPQNWVKQEMYRIAPRGTCTL